MERRPDSVDKGVRFGCGFVVGFLVAFLIGLRVVSEFTGSSWAIIVGIAVLIGILAMAFGDSFWDWLRYWFWW